MARGFRFRLEVVETLRRRARDAKRRVVAEKLRVVTDIEQRVTRLTTALKEGADLCRASQQGGGSFDIQGMNQHVLRRGWLEQSVASAAIEKERARSELAQAQGVLAEASQHLRVIEKLHERQLKRYRAEIAHRAQAESDEATLQRYVRRQRTGNAEMIA